MKYYTANTFNPSRSKYATPYNWAPRGPFEVQVIGVIFIIICLAVWLRYVFSKNKK